MRSNLHRALLPPAMRALLLGQSSIIAVVSGLADQARVLQPMVRQARVMLKAKPASNARKASQASA